MAKTKRKTTTRETGVIHCSVIMPVYARPTQIQSFLDVSKAVDSVLSQTDQSFEIIIVHDGQNDAMRAMVAKIADSRIRYYEVPFRGIRGGHHSIQFAMELVSDNSEFVLMLNGDNMIYPQYVEKMYDPEADIVTCMVKMNDMPGITIDGTSFARGRIDRLNYIVRTRIAKDVGYNHMNIDSDWNFIVECVGYCQGTVPIRLKNIQQVLGEHN